MNVREMKDGQEVAKVEATGDPSMAQQLLQRLAAAALVTNYDAVGLFHQRFDLDHTLEGTQPRLISDELEAFRVKFLQEELDELKEGYATNDLPKIADALVDLVYVALGTAQLHGLPWEALFNEVQRANMTKVRAAKAEDSLRGSTFDVVKPAGWTPPNIVGVLRAHGWKD